MVPVRSDPARRVCAAAAATLVAVAFSATFAAPALAAAGAEAIAKAALKKAKADYAAQNYGRGAARVQKVLKACGASKCTAPTHAALLMDLGAMQLKKRAKEEATAAFAEAAKLQPGIAFDPAFDGPEVRAAFAAATGKGGGAGADTGEGGEPGGGAAPTGDFGHTPPAEQAANTPLPLYVDGGPDAVTRVVVKYRTEGSSSWKRIDLKKLGGGWAGLVPCGDVKTGTLRYYIQGLDDAKTPIGNNGDARRPYRVKVKDTLSGEAPHLPGKDPPKSCSESSDCPPDFPGCSKSGASAGDNGEDNGDSDPGDDDKKPRRAFKRFWVGAGTELELVSLPSGNDVCALDPSSALPQNGSNLYCTTKAGADFPTRTAGPGENTGLCTAAAAAAGLCPGDAAGHSNGGLARGNVRLMLAFDYALTANLLVGARLGATLFPYSGQAAVNDGRAFGSRLYGELRGTWVFGDDALGTTGIKPLVLLGAGIAQFDAHASSGVAYCPLAANATTPPAGKCPSAFVAGTVDVWQTGGPGFATLGGGARWAATDSIAVTAALRVNMSFGANGLIPTYGPELTAQYGF